MFQFPPLTPTCKKLLVALGAIYILGALASTGSPTGGVFTLFALFPAAAASQPWTMLTHVLVLPPGPDGFWALIIGLLFVWLGGAQFEQRYGSKRMLQLCAAGTVGAGLGALVLGLLAHSAGMNSGALLGPSALWLALFIGYMTTMGQQQISFFGIFPLRADQVVWLFVGLSVLQQVFSTNPSALGGDLGAMASGVLFVRWMQNPPRKGGGKKRRKAGKKRGKRGPLRVVRDDEEPPNYLN